MRLFMLNLLMILFFSPIAFSETLSSFPEALMNQDVESYAKSKIFDFNLVAGTGREVQKSIQMQLQLIKVEGKDFLYARFNVPAVKIYAPIQLAPGQYPYQYEAVELFFRTDPNLKDVFTYYEIELSPYNDVFQVRIDNIHTRKKFVNGDHLNISTRAHRTGEGWVGEMWISMEKLTWSGRPEDITGNMFAILGEKPSRSYFSVFTPPQQKPNFHLPELFEKFF